MRIDWLLYHVASGHAFFTGAGLLVAAVGLRAVSPGRPRAVSFLAIVGALLVAVSATPLPWAAYGVWAGLLAAWAVAERREPRGSRRLAAFRVAAVAGSVAAVAFELPYHVTPAGSRPRSAVGVIGDSVTAGMGENEATTWPTLVARRHGLTVHDFSAMGATAASARNQAAKLRRADDVVIIEIGGNDMLGSTTAAKFEGDLDALLSQVAGPGRRVYLFELPLPPGFNAYGTAQRRVAARHGVRLVPKRALMGVLTADGATVDTIHLSQAGHDRFATLAADLLGQPATRRPDR